MGGERRQQRREPPRTAVRALGQRSDERARFVMGQVGRGMPRPIGIKLRGSGHRSGWTFASMLGSLILLPQPLAKGAAPACAA